ncbi:MAG TPA: TIGR03621 family F420-dependent LLM class oxidoreductase [Chloroflexota bacterium]
MHTRPFRFGVSGGPQTLSELRHFARRIEDLGFATWLIADHFGPQMAPAPAMVFVATATSRLRVGTFVYDNDFRHPALLAKEVATVDALTGGRFEFGLGAGWNPLDYERTGIAFDPPRARVDRFAQTVDIVRAYLSQDEVTFTGADFRIQRLPSGPKPVQPRIPLMIGASGRRMLRLAAQHADIVSLQTVGGIDAHADHVAGVERKLADLRAFAGARFDAIELNISLDVVERTDDVDSAADRFAAKRNTTRDGALRSPWALFGTPEAMAEQLVERRERFGISYPVIMARDLEAFAPVVSRLAGT